MNSRRRVGTDVGVPAVVEGDRMGVTSGFGLEVVGVIRVGEAMMIGCGLKRGRRRCEIRGIGASATSAYHLIWVFSVLWMRKCRMRL